MIVRVIGGLCNRLRTVLSYRAAGVSLFQWVPDGEIANARFDDVFEPLAGVQFVDTESPDIVTCDPSHEAPGWETNYRSLRLRPEHLARVKEVRPPYPYAAMHIRRTDHKDYEPARLDPTTDDEFHRWVATLPGVYTVFLATDNALTQREFPFAIANRLIDSHPEQDTGGHRNTSLADAAVDIFVCAGAHCFMGSKHSSFTDTIVLLRSLGGWWT